MLRFSCPNCKTVLQIQDSQRGQLLGCPRCRTQIQIPTASTPSTAETLQGWYYVLDRKKVGPVPFAALQELALTGRLQPTDMVFQDGSPKWVAASSVDGLFPAPTQPTTPQVAATQVPAVPTNPSPGVLAKLKDVVQKLKGIVGNLQEAHQWVLKVAGIVPIVAGLLGDFLRPIAPFNGVLFLLALLGSGSLIFLFIRSPKSFGYTTGGTCVVLLLATVGFGGWWGLEAVLGRNSRGVMGSTIAPIGHLQAAVMTVRSDSGVTTQSKVEGDKLAEEVRKEMERENNAEKLFHYAFQNYPANVIKAESIGEPRRRRGTGNEIVLEYDLRIGVDVEQYDTVVSKKLLPILDKVALRKGEFLAQATASKDDRDNTLIVNALDGATQGRLRKDKPALKFSTILEMEEDRSGSGYGSGWWRGKQEDSPERVVAVNTSRNGTHDRTTWKWYHVPRPVGEKKNQQSIGVRVDVSFKKKDGVVINRDQVLISGQSIPGACLEYDSVHRDTPIVVSPYLQRYRHYAQTITFTQAMRFTTEELQELGAIHCSVESLQGQ